MSNKDRSKRIWWLASYPKSGNTWIRMFLNCYATGFPININAPFQYAMGDLTPAIYQLTSAMPIDQMTDLDVVYYRSAVLMNLIYTRGSHDIALKTHHAKVSLDDIPLIPPRLSKGVLYIVRDPRDVVPSLADHMGKTIDEAIEMLAQPEQIIAKKKNKLYHVLSSWSSHVDSWTIHNQSIPTTIVYYENLCRDPEAGFRDVLHGLGFPEDRIKEDRFRFALQETAFEKLQELEAKTGFKELGKGEKFFRSGPNKSWQEVLTPEQVERIENTHRHTMERMEYKLPVLETVNA